MNQLHKTQPSRALELPQFEKILDIFVAKIPSFNLRGKSEVKTSSGASASILIFMLTFIFALLKLQHLVLKKNPTIMTNTSDLAEGERFNMGSDSLMMAFAIENARDGVPRSDPNYIKWMA